ncbi:glyoxalase superfamily protein [Rhodanobacter sp. FW106-PBR-LB-2-11]|uniref:glyoxalase superfamily protein n=1 Tax=Rhodanobacter sp. FW106-PBR-LB-2-11 TaxID=1524463 RepID=UPI0034E4B106
MKEKTEISRYKQQATRLRSFLQEGGTHIKQTHALEAVAKMHGFPNYNTLKGAIRIAPGDATSVCLTVLLDRVLEPKVAIQMDDDERIGTGMNVMNEFLQDCVLPGASTDPVHAATLLYAALTLCPLLALAMLDGVRFVPSPDGSDPYYTGKAGWFTRIVARSSEIIATLEGTRGADRVRAMELRDTLGLDEAICGASYALALSSLELGHIVALANHLEAAVDYLPLDDFQMEQGAVMAWLVLGEYDKAIDAGVTDYPLLFNRQQIEITEVLEGMHAVARGEPGPAPVEEALLVDGFVHDVVERMRRKPQPMDAFSLHDAKEPFVVPTRVVTSVIDTDVATAFAVAALRDEPVATWFEGLSQRNPRVPK